MVPFTTKQLAPNVLEVVFDKCKAGDKFAILCRSDAHHDNLHANHKLEKQHLDQALALNAGIIDHGDLFCAMQGKWDKRSDTRQLRPELQKGNYLDELVRYNASFYAPYAENWIALTPGNHCTSIRKHHETCLTTRFAEHIAAKTGMNIPVMTYCGWVLFRFQAGTARETVAYYWHHGYGGGGPVTKGTIQTARMASYIDGAKVVYSGHTHDEWIFPIEKHGISQAGKPYYYRQWFVRGAGYKDEHSPSEGWHIERGGPPKAQGAVLLEFDISRQHPKPGEKENIVQVSARLMI